MGPIYIDDRKKENIKLKNKAKQPVKTKQKQYRGLCEVCINADECTFPRNTQKPVSFCGEFEGYPQRHPKVNDHKIRTMVSAMQRKEAVSEEPEAFEGLCRYCTRAIDCTYPKKPGGVWFCDEYEE